MVCVFIVNHIIHNYVYKEGNAMKYLFSKFNAVLVLIIKNLIPSYSVPHLISHFCCPISTFPSKLHVFAFLTHGVYLMLLCIHE